MIVNVLSKTRQPPFRLALALAGLALAVFFWGLGYKLSLYAVQHSSFHRIPTARLLSRNEDTNANEFDSVFNGNVAPDSPRQYAVDAAAFLILWALFATLSMPPTWSWRREIFRPCPTYALDCLNAFFFRPPPALS